MAGIMTSHEMMPPAKRIPETRGLRGPCLHRVHEKGVDAAEAEPPEHSACKRTTSFTCDENIGAGGAFGKYQISVFLDDELAAERHHEQDTKPTAQERKRENAPEGEFRAEAQKNQGGDREHDARSKRFTGGARRLHDVVFQNGGAAKRAKDADGEHGDGDGCGDG